jgi:predicted ATPase/DNA-binding CsgD family transcriptional regulator
MSRARRQQRANLPPRRTRLIGREQDLASACQALLDADGRLVTLTGAGGCGKTRLALEVAANLAGGFQDGVWLVEFASLSDPTLVLQSVGTVVGVREQLGRSMLATIVSRLRQRQMLLVLDNCEHLLEACALLADAVLDACPRVRVLATSREPLRIDGERTWRVPSLSVPELRPVLDLWEVARFAAVQLFVERAQAVQQQFELTPQNVGAVAQVCARLDGMPLAIELAAARVAMLGVEQILERLDKNFQVLEGRNRTAPKRQQTLQATLDWGYGLLGDAERRLFRRLAVFRGGWTLEAAEAVCPAGDVEPRDILELLGQLVDKSLVQVETHATGAARYRYFETVRAYARERLEDVDEVCAVRTRHAWYFTGLLRTAEPALLLQQWGPWLDVLEREHDNLRAALDWLTEQGREADVLLLAPALSQFWEVRGYAGEGRERLERLLAVPGVDARARAAGLSGAHALEWSLGDFVRMARHSAELVALCEELGDGVGVAAALHDLAVGAIHQGRDDDARLLLERHLALSRRYGVPPSPHARVNLANVAREVGDFARARPLYDDALAQDAGSPSMRANIISEMGRCALYAGDLSAARAWQSESLAVRRKLDERRNVPFSLTALAFVAITAGEPATARALLEESVPLHQRVGDIWGQTLALEGLAGLVALTRPADALRLAGAADAIRTAMQRPVAPAQKPLLERWLAPARQSLPANTQADALAEGRTLSVDDALALGLRLIAPPSAESVDHALLTARQQEVAELLSQGLSNRQIAERLVVTERTVAAHIEHILDKLDLSSRTQIALWRLVHPALLEFAGLPQPEGR